MRILMLALRLPFPADDGGKLRVAHVALHLAQQHEVTLACFADGAESLPLDRDVSDRFLDVQVVPAPAPGPRLRHWLARDPSEVQRFRNAEMARRVQTMIARFSPEVLVVTDPVLSGYVIPYPDRVRILDYACVDTLQFERLQTLSPGSRQPLWVLRRLKFVAYLRRIAPDYDLCLVNSEEDRAALLEAAPAWRRVEVLPNGLNLSAYPLGLAPPQVGTLVYPGSVIYPPNLDAVTYFIQDILPQVRAQVPEVRFLITGRVATDGSAPQAPGVVYTGYVPDVRPVVAGAWVCTVPLRAGAGGTRFKVLESLALGTPLVSTAIGVEGVAVTDGVDALLAEEPSGFAAQTVKVLRSPDLRSRLAAAGRRLIEQRYDWEVLGARFAALAGQLVAQPRAGTRTRIGGDRDGSITQT